MTYGPLVVAALTPVAPGRVFADSPPDNAGRAAHVIFQRVGGVPAYFSEGELPDKQNSRIQLFVWTERRELTQQLTTAILRIVARHPSMQPLTAPTDDYEPTLKIYGSRVDVSLWHPFD